MRGRSVHGWVGLILALLLHSVQAQESADDLALQLADNTAHAIGPRPAWRAFAEAGVQRSSNSELADEGAVAGIDLRADVRLTTDLNFIFSDRYDRYFRVFPSGQNKEVNSLRELYFDWRATPHTSAQWGRINLRQGVATGYNPSDFFRARALRSAPSIDPEALRTNRLGVVALAVQNLWASGAANVILAPRLADAPSTRPFGLDVGSTNAAHQALLTLTQEITPEFKPQVSALWRENSQPQFGLNLSTLMGHSTVARLEWSGGRGLSMRAAALGTPEDVRFFHRAALGLTTTTENKLSLTAEYVYNGSGFSAAGWQALQAGGPSAIGSVLLLARDRIDPPSKQNWFFHATWKDLLQPHLDLSAFARLSEADQSRQTWLELRYRLSATSEIYAQYQENKGAPGSVYGSTGVSSIYSAFFKYYFL